MARLNSVSLLGILQREPQIYNNNSQAMMFVKVTRGPRSVGDGRTTVKYDSPVVWSMDEEIIKQMATLTVGDIILVKGMIATVDATKHPQCPHCGEKISLRGSLTYINPIHIVKINHIDNEEEAIKFLQENGELSNQVFLFGKLTRDPKRIDTKNALKVARYQIAMNRKFRIKTDAPDKKSDYPWIYAYGKNAVDDGERLHVGSEVYVDGCIQARFAMRKQVCTECGQQFEWKDSVMEIVPFSTEYVSEFYTDEEIEQHKIEREEQAKRDVFKNAAQKLQEIEANSYDESLEPETADNNAEE